MTNVERTIKLLPSEYSTFALMLPSVSTFTFYSGKAPLLFLRRRVDEIVRKNPWLEGRLVKANGVVTIAYPEIPLCKSFSVVEDQNLREDMKYEDLCSVLHQHAVKKGSVCLNKDDKALFKVIAVVISPTKFGIFASLSHILGDGFTFYELYGMIGENSKLTAMVGERIDSFPEQLELVISGGNVANTWLFSIGTMINIIITTVFSPRVGASMHAVNPAWVDSQKASTTGPATPFVSTNDILTSWFLRLSGCRVGFMAANFRNRVPGCTGLHAGNYEALLAYQTEDFADASLIRRSLSGFRRLLSGDLPGFFRSLLCPVSIISSWTTFYRDVSFLGCEQTLHVPCFDLSTVVWPIALLFRPTAGALSLLVLSRSAAVLDCLRREPAVAAA